MSDVLPALSWSLLHFLWIGAFAALLLWGTLELMDDRYSQRRYVLALAVLLAMPFVFALTVVNGLMPTPAQVIVTQGQVTLLASAFELGWADSVRAWLSSGLGIFNPWSVLAWALGVLLFSVRLIGGWVWCRRFTRVHALAAGPRWQARLARIGGRVGLRRRARLYLSGRIEVPMVVGGKRPAIVIPRAILPGMSLGDFDALLAHELAHVRRLDGPLNVLQVLVETLFFFHPAVWWISSRARVEREHCCDEVALDACGGALVLARALTRLEERRCKTPAHFGTRALALAATDGCLSSRVERLLGANPRPARRWAGVGLGALGLSGLALGAVPTHAPRPWVAEAWTAEQGRSVHATRVLSFVLRDEDGGTWVESLKPEVHLSALLDEAGVLETKGQYVLVVKARADEAVHDLLGQPKVAFKFASGSALRIKRATQVGLEQHSSHMYGLYESSE